jgi:hypothetical protein
MSRILSASSGAMALGDARRSRIGRTIAALRSQRFVGEHAYEFAFTDVGDALTAYSEREVAMAELVRALAIAELDVRGAYVEDKHDVYFASLGPSALGAEDRALFSDYLVVADGPGSDAGLRAAILEGLVGDAPLKIVLVTDDAFGLDAQMATTALGLGTAFVLQASSAPLLRVSAELEAALAFPGPALVSIYAPGIIGAADVAPYLASAAATESRAFPTFTHDPTKGVHWSERVTVYDEPVDRTTHELEYADASARLVRERIAFTPADLALLDDRLAGDFALVPRERWHGELVPMADWLDDHANGSVPFVYAIDDADRLHRAVVSDRLARRVARSLDAWRRLCELASPPAAVATIPAPAAPARTDAPVATATASVAVADRPDAAEVASPASDEPYIETPRCTTCNECTHINPRMFAYNENRQAYIKDPGAGTYKELVEAAEGCQVAIIHPGKPRDPKEPGLAELIERAAPFR